MSRNVYDTLKKRNYVCLCGKNLREIRWGRDPLPSCECGLEMHEDYGQFGLAPAVIGDEVDIYVRHGICDENGNPKRFRSKSELRRAAFESGWTISGETPKSNPRLNEQKWKEAEAKGRNWI